ncbi:FAA hydrolase family protein [Natronospirillum operosum]|uniref:FAA hydrolase family protein n=1 Tax=Natronospirillum operosum TaxID=2759953 RepID=A0A4Z0W6D4_9GAMM|nr:fumarylacetoacetate hydrolase family protein [Natronospirillum operosum]TGG93354.1 FAA hydrolase family protein [Natronospirillum operosum]
MTDHVIPPPPRPELTVAGQTATFPLRRVFCVGRNYAAHALEMGKDPEREPPFFFCKPADAVVPAQGTLPYPPLTGDLHHEVELVLAIGQGGADIPAAEAMSHVWGATVGLDLTRRDLQAEAKNLGRPWDWGKSFDAAAPCAPLRPLAELPALDSGRIWLQVNGELRQEGNLDELIWKLDEVIALCSQSVRLQPGDLIFTGTPAGVGAINAGDRVDAGIDGIAELSVTIA